ncbi:MAG TPA: ROK family protein [Paenirhodobacter sp.]
MTVPTALVFDLGGTQMRAALVDGRGGMLASASADTPAHSGVAAVVQGLSALARRVMAGQPAPAMAGLCAPGPLDADRGVMISPPTLTGWHDVPIRDLLAAELGLPVTLENDANAAALGEAVLGAGRGMDTLVFVTISTGIGAGIVVNGQILRGRQGLAGEIGHMKMTDHGPTCLCGATGCFETLASGSALGLRLARDTGAAQAPTGQQVAEAARRGDPAALAAIQAHGRAMGRGFSNIFHLLAPDALVIGGGLSQAFDLLAPAVAAEIERSAMPPYRDTPILLAGLGGAAGLHGMAHLVKVHQQLIGREENV